MSLSVWPWRPARAACRPSGQAGAAAPVWPSGLGGGGGGGWASAAERLGEAEGPPAVAAGPGFIYEERVKLQYNAENARKEPGNGMQFAIGSWAGQSMYNLLKKRKHEEISRDPARTVSHGLVQSVDNAPRLRCYRETIQSRLH